MDFIRLDGRSENASSVVQYIYLFWFYCMLHEVTVDEHIIYVLFCIPLNFCVIISCTSCNLLFTNNTLDPATLQSKQRRDQLLVWHPGSFLKWIFLKMQHTCGTLMTSGGTIMPVFLPSANKLHLAVLTDNQMTSAWKGWFWSLSDVKFHPRNCWTHSSGS